jgi:hypothetical protein
MTYGPRVKDMIKSRHFTLHQVCTLPNSHLNLVLHRKYILKDTLVELKIVLSLK